MSLVAIQTKTKLGLTATEAAEAVGNAAIWMQLVEQYNIRPYAGNARHRMYRVKTIEAALAQAEASGILVGGGGAAAPAESKLQSIASA